MNHSLSVKKFGATVLIAVLALGCDSDSRETVNSPNASAAPRQSAVLTATPPHQVKRPVPDADSHFVEGTEWDASDGKVRTILKYEASSQSFIGRLENTSAVRLCELRAVIRLANGTELGPTKATDVAAGESVPVELSTNGAAVARWTARVESSPCP